VGLLAGGIAHDFNNLLTVINGTAELAAEGLPPRDPLRAALSDIRHAGDTAAGLTRQLLAFGRRQVLQPTVVDLNAVVDDVARMIRRVIGEDIELVIEAAPGLGSVRADRGQIEQVIVNLAVNARDAMPGGGRLVLATRDVALDGAQARGLSLRAGPHVELTVRDTGVGMDAGTVEHVFEPFFTTKPVGHGTGLGLSTAYGIVRQSGGAIAVESEPGRGSAFRVLLPRITDDEAGPATADSAPGRGGTETVMVVEDEELVRRLAATSLRELGYHVLEAADGAEALRLLERHGGPVDLLVTDVVMPGMGGPELARRLAMSRPRMRVIHTSGSADGAELGIGSTTPFLAKPYSMAALARKVREALDAEVPAT
jgi:CheY-like chemotaxis protein